MIADIDFNLIAPRLSGKREAFEEFCCQLARREIPECAVYTRLEGAGGDGGVESFADLPDGNRIGWQAKYVFKIGPLLTQATKSLKVALQNHPTLTKYILCFPFDLTGPTGRAGRSGIEKFNEWRDKQVQKAAEHGRNLKIEEWPESKLRSLLLEFDVSGGITTYFFDKKILSSEWFGDHIKVAQSIAGPRYTPELNVFTDVEKWFSAFGRTPEWVQKLEKMLKEVNKKYRWFSEAIIIDGNNSFNTSWPKHLLDEGMSVSDAIRDALETCGRIKDVSEVKDYQNSLRCLDDVLSKLSSLEDGLIEALEKQHGQGKADSLGFREFMAEHMVSRPAANLDATRDVHKVIHKLRGWIKSTACYLAFHSVFVLSGAWGVGKTHIVCDVASQRLKKGFLSCVAFGHQFDGKPDPWTRLAENLGLPITLGKDKLLDMLNAAAEGSRWPLILFIDAINETRPLQYWRNRLRPFIAEIGKRRNLLICLTCRTPFLDNFHSDLNGILVSEHPGFKGVEHIAATAFFEYYGLKPPVAPILQPEFSNPLYLRLTCETLKSLKMDRLPSGWIGSESIISAFLKRKEEEFAQETEGSRHDRIVTGSLFGIARSIADAGAAKLSRRKAIQVIQEVYPNSNIDVVNWLVRENLLIEEVSDNDSVLDTESTVRPAFERLGDFLIAWKIISEFDDEMSVNSAFDVGGRLNNLVQNEIAVKENFGVLSALSIVMPEKYPCKELSSLPAPAEVRDALLKIVVTSIPWRNADSFSHVTENALLEALNNPDFYQTTMDSLLSVSWRPSAMDSIWLHGFLNQLPLARRDANWCVYLHLSYENSGPVKRLIEATFGLNLDALDKDIAERWSVILLWFTAAADRRVKDWATRALMKLLVACPAVVPELLKRCLCVNDDEVRERLLLASYGALINTRNADEAEWSAKILLTEFRKMPQDFDNALLRDHIRCIGELAHKLKGVPGNSPQLVMQPIDSEWPLKLPTEDEVEEWGKQLHFTPDEFFSDFFKYSMNCLRTWTYEFTKEYMGKWILQRIARDFEYFGSNCKIYDDYMIGKYGGGRSKPTWAERIGKKYQWIAMYQLASRLQDHIERKKDDWALEPLQTPLILLEERRLDPTLLVEWNESVEVEPWWITESADLDSAGRLSDKDWVAKEEDIPALETLISAVEHSGQNWRVLAAYPSWGQRDEDAKWGDTYRNMWIHINSYLVRKEDFEVAERCLCCRNFFGQWMPRIPYILYGFAGEYPWATPFNTEAEEWDWTGKFGITLPVELQPSSSKLVGEWEYDSSIQEYYHMQVPARSLFIPADLWWNGQNGYRLAGGRTVFQDPSLTASRPAALLGDVDNLLDRLNKLEFQLVWTLLGEKWILGGHTGQQSPRRTFSQTAYLREDNSVQIEKRVFFDDYDRDTGPLTNESD